MKVFGLPWCIMGRINETEIPSLISNLNFLAVCEKNTKQIQRTHPHCSCTACLLAPILTHSLTQVRFESPGLARWPQPTGSDSTACFLDGNVFRLTHISYLETFTRKKNKKNNEKPDKKGLRWDVFNAAAPAQVFPIRSLKDQWGSLRVSPAGLTTTSTLNGSFNLAEASGSHKFRSSPGRFWLEAGF